MTSTPSSTKPPLAEPEDSNPLVKRLGKDLYMKRLKREAEHLDSVCWRRHWGFPNKLAFFKAIERSLKIVGLYEWGRKKAQSFELEEVRASLPNLPKVFNGYRILHLTDLHLDIDPQITDALLEELEGLRYDLCVITGDFRNSLLPLKEEALTQIKRVTEVLRKPIYGVLGNHDYLESAPKLESFGIQLLFNEKVAIRNSGETLYLCGIDDPHYFRTDDLEAACSGIPSDACTLLLSHSPEIYKKAEAFGIQYVMSGHTHGGQLCLPGRIPITGMVKAPRYLFSGKWQYKSLQGYTSRGAGCCGLPVRLFCPPEITLHTLETFGLEPIKLKKELKERQGIFTFINSSAPEA